MVSCMRCMCSTPVATIWQLHWASIPPSECQLQNSTAPQCNLSSSKISSKNCSCAYTACKTNTAHAGHTVAVGVQASQHWPLS
jgi:hypothetical protein